MTASVSGCFRSWDDFRRGEEEDKERTFQKWFEKKGGATRDWVARDIVYVT